MAPFGEALLLWRLERGWTQEEMARRSGISRPNLSAMERGKREVSLRTLRALAAALQIRPGLLADGTPPLSVEPSRPFSRQALNRIADAIVYGTSLRESREQRLAEQMRPLVRSRVLAAGGRVRKARGGKRALQAAWLRLASGYPPAEIRALLRRIADRQRFQG